MKSKTLKRVLLLVGAFLLVIAAAVFVVWRYYVRMNQKIEVSNVADIEWYSEDETEFTISTAEELYDFAVLSDFYDFEGQTIKLGADIVVNEGNAENWAMVPPVNLWYPVTGFAGTFDGQGHTISGLYGKGTDVSMGLFADTEKSCVIEDFRLVNSYFDMKGSMGLAGIVGGWDNAGTLRRIYTDAILKCNEDHVGGIVSVAYGTLTLEECWFDGEISAGGWENGGIIGSIKKDAVNMSHCLNSGSVKTTFIGDEGVYTGSRTGGLIGNLQWASKATLIADDCLNVGNVSTDDEMHAASVIGVVDSGTTATLTNIFTTQESYKTSVNKRSGTINGTAIVATEEKLTGFSGYQWTTLDFDNYWAVVEDGTPVLKYFADEVPDVSTVQRSIDTSWYKDDGTEFLVDTWNKFYGFNMLSVAGLKTFKGQTIKLGANITYNQGKAADWAKKAPEFTWHSIANFAGTFDGQGHTISGLYVNSTEANQGMFAHAVKDSVIKNFSLKNSYFSTSASGNSSIGVPIGSIVGTSAGVTLENIYSDAIVVSTGETAWGAGGLIGDVSSGTTTIRNCWFNGSVDTYSYGAGGIIGDMQNANASVEHCLNSGSVTKHGEKENSHIGGIIGYLIGWSRNAILTLNDTVNVGSITSDNANRVGSIAGYITGNASKGYAGDMVGGSVFVSEESCGKAVGGGSSTLKPVVMKEKNLTGYNGYVKTTLDFEHYWAVVLDDTPILKSFATKVPSVAGYKRYDTTWYSDSKKTFVLTDKYDLYGFGLLSAMGKTFEGKTVTLGNSISLNDGNAADWATTEPDGAWVAIQNFAGTFDGKNHTISGLYIDSKSSMQGLFGSTEETAIIKNFRLENSYICVDATGTTIDSEPVGSIVGAASGTIENVYSNAMVISKGQGAWGTGGIAGDVNATTLTIRNCWFDGTVEAYQGAGGIIGSIQNGTANVEHCLNSGSVTKVGAEAVPRIGGICGYVIGWSKDGILNLNDTLNVGKVTAPSKNQIGSVVGLVTSNPNRDVKGDVTGTNVYSTSESYGKSTGSSVSLKPIVLSAKNLTGYNGYKMTTLDFASYWAVAEKSTPILQKFASSIPSLAGQERYDTSWYNASARTLVIQDKYDLYGFGLLSAQGITFRGQMVELARSIDLNSGNLTNGQATDATEPWIPVQNFAGTFDGKGFTISGMYANSTDANIGFFGSATNTAVIKNFRLENSYFCTSAEGVSWEETAIGSIVGTALGATIENIKSTATVVSKGEGAWGTGGIVGDINTNNAIITNCWFGGKVDTYYQGAGGIVGSIQSVTVKISHCLNSGTITKHGNQVVARVGGIVGYVSGHSKNGIADIVDTLNVGTVTSPTGQAGSVVGMITSNASKGIIGDVTGYNVYTTTESNGKAFGGAASLSAITFPKSNYEGYDGYIKTLLDFDNYWAVVEDDTPILKWFATTVPPLDGYERYDISWYSETKTEFTLMDKSDLYGFTFLTSLGKDFQGKTVKLGADITVNEGTPTTKAGWDEYLKTNADALDSWIPIGNSSTQFAGTFDGQNHTIRGIYMVGMTLKQGFFGYTLGNGRATVQNFRLEDSYFTSAYQSLGSVAGEGNGTFKNIYSNAVVVSTATGSGYIGGVIGSVMNDITNSMTNCWFDGSVTATDNTINGANSIAGLVGYVGNFDMNISNSLNSGTVTAMTTGWPSTGGLIGWINTSGTVTLSNVLNTGKVNINSSANDRVQRAGTIIGNIGTARVKGGNIVVEGKAIATSESLGANLTYLIGPAANPTSLNLSACKQVTADSISGYNATSTGFDFDKTWTYSAGTPVLKSLAKTRMLHAADTSWYDDNKTADSYTISTIEQFVGLAKLSQTSEFATAIAGKTIYLDGDITLNTGNAADWAGKAPTYEWMPIGSLDNPFTGNFDGQGHTISGIYVNSTAAGKGLFGAASTNSIIKDFRLVNSYIYSDNESVGSIAGVMQGSLEGVYSNAIVKGATSVGGLIGIANAANAANTAATVTITDCWYEGNVTATGLWLGGLIGTAWNANVRIDNCLAAGILTSTYVPANSSPYIGIGGLIGQADGKIVAYVSMTNTVVAGKITASIADASLVTENRVNYAVGHWNNGAPVSSRNQAAANNMPICSNLYGVKGVTPSDYVVALSLVDGTALMNDAQGTAPNLFTGTAKWAARAGELPVPKYFTE